VRLLRESLRPAVLPGFIYFQEVRSLKKKIFLAILILVLVLIIVEPCLAATGLDQVEGKVKNTVISFQKLLKWVGIGSFLFGAAQYTLGRKQQGKFFMTGAAIGFCFVMAVYFIFSLIEGMFSGLV
jgi:uncharacterized membrane protein YraQ (UPF0718 family)